jgi:hypothetical protein
MHLWLGGPALLCHFETSQQFHITWCAAGGNKAIARVSLCCVVLAPVILEFVARFARLAGMLPSRGQASLLHWPPGRSARHLILVLNSQPKAAKEKK